MTTNRPATPNNDEMLERWMTQYQGGDTAAFAKLFDALAPRLLRYLLRLVRNQSLAEDLVQITFLKLHRAKDLFRDGERVAPWAFTIAHNALRDEIRKSKRDVADLTADGELPWDAVSPILSGSGRELELVERAIESLSEEQREAVLLHKIEGMSMEDIASVLGISSGAARVRAHRGYKAIAAFLQEHRE